MINWNQEEINYLLTLSKKEVKILIFRDRFDILLEMRLSGVAEQEYTGLYGKSRL